MIIYKVTNIVNNKIYIGQTTKTLQRRKSTHYGNARGKKGNVFHQALMKYKKSDFEWSVICKCETLDELNEKEIQYIENNKSLLPNGYNMTEGGFTSPMINPTPELLSKHKKHIKIAMQSFCGENNVMKRPEVIKKHKIAVNNPERCRKHSEWMKENYRHTEQEIQRRCKYYLEVEDLSGTIHIIHNLKQWCRDNPYYTFNGIKTWAKKQNGKPHKGLTLICYRYISDK